MTAFDDMAEDLFADPNLAADVVYVPAGGVARTVRAMASAPDIEVGPFETKAKGSPMRLDFRIGEAPEMKSGDTVTISDTSGALGAGMAGDYRIASCEADDSRLFWKTTLRVAS
jgi:hypothetical protein